MRILQLCKKFPYPLKDGESIAVTYLSRAMVEEGCQVTLLTMNTEKHFVDLDSIPDDYDHYESIHCAYVDNKLHPVEAFLNLFSKDSYHVSRFVSKDFEEKLIWLLRHNEYDVVQLETLYLTPYIEVIKQHSNALVTMRSHNIEFEIWERITKNTSFLPKRMYLRYLTKKLRNYELERLNDYDYLIAVSDRDLQRFKQLGYRNGAMSTPIGLELKNYTKQSSIKESHAFCFIGALDWMPNIEGLEWFLNEVWPVFIKQRPNAKFYVAGRNMPTSMSTREIEGVIFEGEVPDAISFINKHTMMVVPLFSGSGTRVKILEGMALNKTIISTTLGLEGINAQGGEHLFIADNVATFVDQMIYTYDNPEVVQKVGNNAAQFVRANYDHQEHAKNLISKYEYLLSSYNKPVAH